VNGGVLFFKEKFMRCFLIVFVTILCFLSHARTNFAADPDFPNSLLGFIRPGMLIGIQASRDDSLVSIEIFDEEQFRFAKDARSMKLEELKEKYPKVSEEAAKALAAFESSIDAQLSNDARRTRLRSSVEPSVALDVDRATVLGTVLHVTDDYFLVRYGDDNPRKQVVAKQAVTRIRWASDDIQFRKSLQPVRTPE
jgi:hypothetical protein